MYSIEKQSMDAYPSTEAEETGGGFSATKFLAGNS
jgi:hypothetical protein